MIGDTILWEIIGANFLTAVAGLHLRTSRFTQLFLAASFFEVPETRFEDGESFELVFELRLLILTGDDQSCREVCDAYRRVGGVHALAAMTGRAIYIDADVGILDVDFNVLVGLGQHDNLGGRGMNTAIGLGDGNTLYAVGTALIFEAIVSSLAADDEGDIFNTALAGFVDIQDFHLP